MQGPAFKSTVVPSSTAAESPESPQSEANALNVILVRPELSAERINREKKSDKGSQPPKWIIAAKAILRNVPTASAWENKMYEVGGADVLGLETAVRPFTRQPTLEFPFDRTKILERAKTVATRIASFAKYGSIAKSPLQRFLVLLFLSYCAALNSTDLIPSDELNALMRVVVSQANDWHLQRLRNGAILMNKLIYSLSLVGWQISRATSGFFIYGPPVYRYADLNHSESVAYMTEQLKAREYVDYKPSHSLTDGNLFVPALISAWDPALSLGKVSKILGYPEAVFSDISQQPFACARAAETTMLPLLHIMGGRVPKTIFDHVQSAQQIVGTRDHEHEVTVHATALHEDLREIFSDERKLEQGLQELTSASRVRVEELADGEKYYICESEPRQLGHEWIREFWAQQAFEFCCFAFTRAAARGSLSRCAARELLKILQHILRLHTQNSWELPRSTFATQALLSASTFGELSDRQILLGTAISLQENTCSIFLKAEITHQRSVLLRLKGDICGSEKAIQGFLRQAPHDAIPKSHHLFGLLCLSQAANKAYRFQFSEAHQECQRWELSSNLSEFREDVVWDQMYCVGRLLRGQGHFQEAKRFFECCFEASSLYKSRRYLITSVTADLYCELDYLQYVQGREALSRNFYLRKAKRLIEAEVDTIRTNRQHPKGFRRLLASLIEVEIRMDEHERARVLLQELLNIYDGLPEPDIVDRLGHVRALISWARVSPFQDSEQCWFRVLEQNKTYNPLESEVFTCGIVRMFLSFLRFQKGDWQGGTSQLLLAQQVLSRNKRQFLIPGLGTYVADGIERRLGSISGQRLICLAG